MSSNERLIFSQGTLCRPLTPHRPYHTGIEPAVQKEPSNAFGSSPVAPTTNINRVKRPNGYVVAPKFFETSQYRLFPPSAVLPMSSDFRYAVPNTQGPTLVSVRHHNVTRPRSMTMQYGRSKQTSPIYRNISMNMPGSVQQPSFHDCSRFQIEPKPLNKPSATITEQPKNSVRRIRYLTEGDFPGVLVAQRATDVNRVHPTLLLSNWEGYAQVTVAVCLPGPLSAATGIPTLHCHYISSNVSDYIFTTGRILMNGSREVVLNQLGLQRAKKHDFTKYMKKAKGALKRLGLDAAMCTRKASEIDLNAVRLVFFVQFCRSINGPAEFTECIYSDVIRDRRPTENAALKISRIDKRSGPVSGNQEVFLLCDVVQKHDIQVLLQDDYYQFTQIGSFNPETDVHNQVAIVFRTPPYSNEHISEDVTVQIMLRKKSNPSEVSNTLDYTYTANRRINGGRANEGFFGDFVANVYSDKTGPPSKRQACDNDSRHLNDYLDSMLSLTDPGNQLPAFLETLNDAVDPGFFDATLSKNDELPTSGLRPAEDALFTFDTECPVAEDYYFPASTSQVSVNQLSLQQFQPDVFAEVIPNLIKDNPQLLGVVQPPEFGPI